MAHTIEFRPAALREFNPNSEIEAGEARRPGERAPLTCCFRRPAKNFVAQIIPRAKKLNGSDESWGGPPQPARAPRALPVPLSEFGFNRLTTDIQTRLKPQIDALANVPRPTGCQKLRGANNLWRIRVGDYRVVYQVSDHVLLVLIVAVGRRREIYR